MLTTNHSLEDIEIAELLEAIYLKYGYDFRQYAKASLYRRLQLCLQDCKAPSFKALTPRIIQEPDLFSMLLGRMSVTVTQLFRHPLFFRTFRENVIPKLRSYPFIKIWHAGCATGEEVYSMAILLHEEGLYDRCQIYGTDYNLKSIKKARAGLIEWQDASAIQEDYHNSGGTQNLTDYFFIKHGLGKIDSLLLEHINFDYHNMISDGIFGEMNVIICQNVMIYFNQNLQNSVLSTFQSALEGQGYLCLGNRETLKHSTAYGEFEVINEQAKIYRRKPPEA